MTQNVYTDCFIPNVGCRMYLDASGQTAAPAGKYSDGTDCYTVNSSGFVTAVNLCGETTTTSTTSTTSTTTSTSTTSTSTTSTSTTTTTAAPVYGVAINYRIAIPETGNYNYSFNPYSASKWPADYFSPTSSGVLSVINDSTRYAFSISGSRVPGTSIPPILFNAISGSFVCDAGLLPYVTESIMSSQNTLCSGFAIIGTGSITYTFCDGNQSFPTTQNVDVQMRVGTFPIVVAGSIEPTASFYGDGTFKPNPLPIFAGSNYESPNLHYLNVVIYSPGYATQSAWIPNGTYTQINGVPIVAGTKVQYFRKSFEGDPNLGFGGTKTTVYPGLIRPYVSWDVHTYTASGDFTYRYQNQF